MISPEMPELIAMCDRIAVVSGGRIKVILKNEGLTQETIISYAI
jgi:ABC-type sugar transport system ATPase subunit